jgi:predicted dithiol-disulfide oxidoreductase (DUF899 family)
MSSAWDGASSGFRHSEATLAFTPEQVAGEGYGNYKQLKPWGTDTVAISVFCKNENGDVFHTYTCYSRRVDMMNGAYHHLDLTQAWIRRHDEYKD